MNILQGSGFFFHEPFTKQTLYEFVIAVYLSWSSNDIYVEIAGG